ncbi:hypothetical protein IWX46DRAFT_596489 [Phyllosticta citricarpa]|uniref:Uncharacterized protein n=1 Tax=Phyllosticta citricarpa TaxID=55181 RepID=A0ABR1MGA8_9PEZI
MSVCSLAGQICLCLPPCTRCDESEVRVHVQYSTHTRDELAERKAFPAAGMAGWLAGWLAGWMASARHHVVLLLVVVT